MASRLRAATANVMRAKLVALKAAGANWVRYDLSWMRCSPKARDDHNWTGADRDGRCERGMGNYVLDLTPAKERVTGCTGESCVPGSAGSFARLRSGGAHYNRWGAGMGDLE